MDERPTQETRAGLLGALLALLVGLIVWLWPIGFGGRMPVGGDVTQFSLGLMAVLGRAHPRRAAAALERPLGLRIPRPGREPDGGLLPAALLLYGLLPLEVGVHGKPGAAHALGRPGGILGGAAVRGLAGRVGAGRASRGRRAASS